MRLSKHTISSLALATADATHCQGLDVVSREALVDQGVGFAVLFRAIGLSLNLRLPLLCEHVLPPPRAVAPSRLISPLAGVPLPLPPLWRSEIALTRYSLHLLEHYLVIYLLISQPLIKVVALSNKAYPTLPAFSCVRIRCCLGHVECS